MIRDLGYHAGLLSLAALRTADDDALVVHCRAVAEVIPVVGFYLQPAVGGRILPYRFWRQLMEIESVVAVKIAPFNRYQTLDVVRAVVRVGPGRRGAVHGQRRQHRARPPHALSVSNMAGRCVERRIVGGLLGHWAIWTRRAVDLLEECHRLACSASGSLPRNVPPQRGGDRLQRRAVRRGQQLCRVHLPASTKSFAAKGSCRAPGASTTTSGSARANGTDRPRPRLLSQPQRRRLCGQTSRRMAEGVNDERRTITTRTKPEHRRQPVCAAANPGLSVHTF